MHLVPLSLQMWKQVCEGAPSSSLALGLHEMQSGSRLITLSMAMHKSDILTVPSSGHT